MMLINRNGAKIGFGKLTRSGHENPLTTELSGLLSKSVEDEVGHHSQGR